MSIRVQDGVVVVELTKDLDLSAAEVLEKFSSDALESGAQFFVIGFEHANLIMSEGIRVLLELTRKTESRHGVLVLYDLGPRVRTILNVTRLIDRFKIVASFEEAMAAVAAFRASRTQPDSRSVLARLVDQVLGSHSESSADLMTGPEGQAGKKSELTAEVERLFRLADADLRARS